MKFTPLLRFWLTIAVGSGLAVALYAPTLALPVLYDDLLHIRITGTLNWVSVWLPTPQFGFYRPFTFAPLLLIHTLFNGYPAGLLHALNVGQHALNAALLMGLVGRLWGRARWALAVGLLFVAFPFSYQAVAVYGHNVHPAITGVLLLGLHTYRSAQTAPTPRARRNWWALTSALFAVGLLTHESAVLFGFLAGGMQLAQTADFRQLAPRKLWAAPWPRFIVVGAAYIVLYRLLPIDRGPQAAASTQLDLGLSALYFLQALAHPFTQFNAWLAPLGAANIIGLGVGLTALGAGWAMRNPARRAIVLWGLLWWGLASALLALSLATEYVLHGPRLLYLGAVGLALVWAMILETLWERPGRGGQAAWVVALGGLLLSNGLFVQARLSDYARLTEPVRALAAGLVEAPTDTGVLLVNLPAWLGPRHNTYPLGAEFTAMLGPYLFAEELVAHNLGLAHPARAMALPDLLAETPYVYGIHDQTPHTALQWAEPGRTWQVFITHYLPTGPQTTRTGWVASDTEPAARAHLGPFFLFTAEALACAPLQLHLALQGDPALAATTSLFAHVLDENGQLLAQGDGPLLGLPPALLPNGRLLHDTRQIEVPEGTPVQVRVGLYDYVTNTRLPVLDAAGASLPEAAWPILVRPCP